MTDSPRPEPTTPATPTPAAMTLPPRRRPGRLAAAWLTGTVALLLAAGAAALWWTWSHPAALPWLLQHVPGLSVQGVQGTLRHGTLQIDAVDLQLPANGGRLRANGLRAEGLALRLRPRPGAMVTISPSSRTCFSPPSTLKCPRNGAGGGMKAGNRRTTSDTTSIATLPCSPIRTVRWKPLPTCRW